MGLMLTTEGCPSQDSTDTSRKFPQPQAHCSSCPGEQDSKLRFRIVVSAGVWQPQAGWPSSRHRGAPGFPAPRPVRVPSLCQGPDQREHSQSGLARGGTFLEASHQGTRKWARCWVVDSPAGRGLLVASLLMAACWRSCSCSLSAPRHVCVLHSPVSSVVVGSARS